MRRIRMRPLPILRATLCATLCAQLRATLRGLPIAKSFARARNVLMAFLLCALALPWFAAARPVLAQIGGTPPNTNVFVTEVRSEAYPRVDAQLYATDVNGLPIPSLQTTDLVVALDGVEVAPEEFTLAPTSAGTQSVVILLDTTTSAQAWASMLASAQLLLNQLGPGDAAALVTFGDVIQVQSTLSTDLQETRDALAAIGALAPFGTQARINQGILDSLSLFAVGTAQEPQQAANRRSIVLLTERAGAGDLPPADQPDNATVAQFAQQEGTGLQNFSFGSAATSAQDLIDLAANTGGRFTALATAGDAAAHWQAMPSMLRPGYLLSLVAPFPANNDDHVLLIAGAGGRPVERTFAAQARPLALEISQPAEGATVSGDVVVAVSANAPAPIASMTFSLANGQLITTTTGAVGGILWDTASLPPGAQSIVVEAVDAVGNIGTAQRGVQVRAPIALAVDVADPSVIVGNNLVVTATVDSAFPGTIVEMYVGRTQVAAESNPVGPVAFLIDTTPFQAGRYALMVRAANSAGYSTIDDSNVLTLLPAPVPATPTQDMYNNSRAWLNAWWLPALISLLGLILLWLIIRAIRNAFKRRAAEAAARGLQVQPQMRVLLTNSGNVRTRFRLRAQAKEGAFKFTFIHNGVALLAPAVEHVAAGGSNGTANGRAGTALTGASYAPAPASTAATSSAGGAPGGSTASLVDGAAKAGDTAKAMTAKVGPVAAFAQRFLWTAGEVIPGAIGDQMKEASLRVRSTQAKTARVKHNVGDVTGDVSELGSMSKQVGKTATGAVTKGSASAPAAPPPSRYSATPAPAASGAFALQPSKGGSNGSVSATSATATSAGGAATKWVETPPINPGDTIGVDLFVQTEKGKSRGKRVALRLMVLASEAEGAKPSVDEVTVTL